MKNWDIDYEALTVDTDCAVICWLLALFATDHSAISNIHFVLSLLL